MKATVAKPGGTQLSGGDSGKLSQGGSAYLSGGDSEEFTGEARTELPREGSVELPGRGSANFTAEDSAQLSGGDSASLPKPGKRTRTGGYPLTYARGVARGLHEEETGKVESFDRDDFESSPPQKKRRRTTIQNILHRHIHHISQQ